jgi:predicted esterase
MFNKYLTLFMPVAQLVSWRAAVPIFGILLFIGAMLWANCQDPFSRKWFALKVSGHDAVNCVALLPKPIRRYPLVIYAHGSGGGLMEDGNELRQMAEMGLATVSLEYDQANEAEFNSEFQCLLNYLAQQKWADTNKVAWVGFSLGANRLWDFVLQHPKQQPQFLLQLSGGSLPNDVSNNLLKLVNCPIPLVHAAHDHIFSTETKSSLVSFLQSNGRAVEVRKIRDTPNDIESDREVFFRCIGEYCLVHLSGMNALQNYHSIAEWEQESPPVWLFCVPAVAWAIGYFAWSQYRKPRLQEKLKLNRYEIGLRCLATVLAIWALSDTALHLVPPHFAVSNRTLAIARKYLVPQQERADFEILARQPIWQGVKLQTLLTHAELANYNRDLINWRLGETNYQQFVLSPVITCRPNEKFNWRRPLWEEFYPRIRRENSPTDAALIVVRHLRERVTIADIPNPTHNVSDIWLRQITDETGFQVIYVAALRSVGVPARLNARKEAELYDGTGWCAAPPPPAVGF